MINLPKRALAHTALLATTLFVVLTPASAQAPTDAQRSAIRSQCRSDYEAHCSSIPPGGEASLQCLQKNMSSLSAAPKAESEPAKPATEAAKPATDTAKPAEAAAPAAPSKAASAPAKKPSDAQVAAIRSACRSDYQKNCAGVPTGGAAALQCLEKNKSKLSGGCQQTVNAASGGEATPAVAAAPTTEATSAAAPALVLRPMRAREELLVLRSACGGDVRALCGGVVRGGGRVMQCLATQAAALSPACKAVLAQFAAR
jgi:hypothetical protein